MCSVAPTIAKDGGNGKGRRIDDRAHLGLDHDSWPARGLLAQDYNVGLSAGPSLPVAVAEMATAEHDRPRSYLAETPIAHRTGGATPPMLRPADGKAILRDSFILVSRQHRRCDPTGHRDGNGGITAAFCRSMDISIFSSLASYSIAASI